MENSSSGVYKNSEDFIATRNLLLSMDYDSGYISHKSESNLDSSSENAENVLPLSSEPIYFSEDALLETPECCKYPTISLEIQRENFEETRIMFNSPILSNCTTHVSGSNESVRSQELNYSGFNSDQCNISPEIPFSNRIVVDSTSVENTKNSMYFSPDLQDFKREAFKNMQNKSSVFGNITNTLATNDPIKKLTLVLSKSEKENIYSVKRKYRSLTPTSEKNFLIKECEIEENKYQESFFEEPVPVITENDCLKCANCNANISDDYTSFEENEISSFNDSSVNEHISVKVVKTEENQTVPVCFNENQIDNSSIFKSPISGAVEEIFKGFKEEEITIDPIIKTEVHIDAAITSPSANLIEECREFSTTTNLDDFHTEREYNNIKTEYNEIHVIKAVVYETLQDILNNLHNSEIKINTNNNGEQNLPEIQPKNEHVPEIQQKTEKMDTSESTETSIECSTEKACLVAQTPDKSIENTNNSGLSPDLFTEDQIEEQIVEEITPSMIYIPKERYIVKKDYVILKKTQNNLKGVIPPRSVTLIRMPINEMLSKIESNKIYFWNSSTVSGSRDDAQSKSLLVNSSMESCKKKEFPSVLQRRGLGLYHNRSKYSEEFEELCVKYGQRYVGAETQSSCTVFETNATSPTKRRNIKSQWSTKSPGKRLSHLARRRITFSSANLQSGSSFLAGSRARQIVVDAKKLDLLSRRRSPRKSPRKTPRKSPRIKTRTPSSSAKKKLAMRFRKVTGEIEKSQASTSFDAATASAKRTLFHSPDEDKKSNRFIPSTSGTSSIDTDFKKTTSKRALFMSPSKSSPLKNLGFKRSPVKRLDFGMEKKRKRTDSESVDGFITKFPRCQSEILNSTVPDARAFNSRTRSELNLSQNRQLKELTTNHKKKLQLAIYEALRSQSVLPNHPQFKIFASNLGRLTRKLFLMTTADCVGVTEKMLRIARVHAFAVVKGKSPEEIYEEFLKQRSKNLKPHGYVAPAATVVATIVEKPQSERKLALFGKASTSENKIERIRKAINFGDDDNR
ncbi:unnamed protein product [Psylliodes chrysocephalus]|uniref:Uncharacterized protein n=1 Tax=Psylliodes chrysocephalus TaxID=3402493 RepID=A0A9P0G947_9CUCU|nr:unnamed protein product [Psylliodes chrysocephala]